MPSTHAAPRSVAGRPGGPGRTPPPTAEEIAGDVAWEIIMLRCALTTIYPVVKEGCRRGYHTTVARPGAVRACLAALAAAADDDQAAAIGARFGPVVLTAVAIDAFRRDSARLHALGYDTHTAEAALRLCLLPTCDVPR